MRSFQFLLIIASSVMGRGNANLRLSNYSVYTCLQDWSASFLRHNTENTDVQAVISHHAMPNDVQLVGGLSYNVTVIAEKYSTATAAFVIIYEDNRNVGVHGQSTSNDDTENINIDDSAVTAVKEIPCQDAEGRVQLPLTFSWTAFESIHSSCLSFISVVFVPGEVWRSRPVSVCKPSDCRHYYTDPTGVITSSSHQLWSQGSRTCTFTIVSPPGHLIQLQFQSVEVQPSTTGICDSYITVSLGEVNEKQHFCGQLTTDDLRLHYYFTKYGVATIHFHMNRQGAGDFTAAYRISDFAWTSNYSDISGTIASPNFPNPYSANSHNVTSIKLPQGFRVLLFLDILDLGNRSNSVCSNDSLSIQDLMSTRGTHIACSRVNFYHINEVIFESDSSTVEITFKSDSVTEGKGFQLFYKGVQTCTNQSLTGISGSLSSPNFPFSYLSNQDCSFVIRPDLDDSINWAVELKFSQFQTQSNSASIKLRDDLCTNDFVGVLNGEVKTRLCGDWTGYDHLLTFMKLSSPVVVRFVSDNSNSQPGFMLTWQKTLETRESCENTKFHLDSVRFEVIYTPQMWSDSEVDCRSRGGHLARIDDARTHELIESNLLTSGCQNVQAFWIGANDLQWESDFYWTTGGKVTHPRWFPGWSNYNQYHQQPSDDGLSSEDCVEVRRRFHLPWKGSKETRGYFWNDRNCSVKNAYICQMESVTPVRASWRSSTRCEINVTLTHTYSNSGSITSIGYPDHYSDFLNCQIRVSSPPGTGIALDFEEFVLEEGSTSATCDYDSVAISSSSNQSRQLCGNWTDKIKLLHHLVHANHVTISFVTDHSRTFKGFSFTASVVNGSAFCGDDSWFLSHQRCYWPSDVSLKHAEAKQSCDSLASTLLDTADLQNIPGALSHLLASDDTGVSTSTIPVWTAQTEQDQNCSVIETNMGLDSMTSNDTLLQERGVACEEKHLFICTKSPRHPESPTDVQGPMFYSPGNTTLSDIVGNSSYPDNINLTLCIQAPENHRILMTFTEIDIEFQENCLYDYLRIPESSFEGRLCGDLQNSSQILLSHTNVVKVHFISDFGTSGRGFALSWSWVDMGQCHQDIAVNSSVGTFRSINFPGPYPAEVECSLTLRASNATDLLVLDFQYAQLLTLFDFMNITFTEDHKRLDSEVMLLNSSLYLSGGEPVFVSDTAYLKLSYSWKHGYNADEGFQAQFYAEPRPVAVPDKLVSLQEDTAVDLYSLNFPGPLPSDVTQTVLVRAPVGYNVQVDLHDITVVRSESCKVSIVFEDISLGNNDVRLLDELCIDKESLEDQQGKTSIGEPVEKDENWDEHVNIETNENATEAPVTNNKAGKLRKKRSTLTEYEGLNNGSNESGVQDTIINDTPSTIVTSDLNRMRVTMSSQNVRESEVKIHLKARIVEDPDYINKTSRLHHAYFDSCEDTTCFNGGVCRQIDDVTATCDCKPRYTGLFCQSLWCSTAPCVQGQCTMTTSGYFCTCRPGYWGQNCELNSAACGKALCSGRGQCLHGNNTHPACACNDDWKGPMCAKRLDEESEETTVGQRLLKEPIWIGLIVILSVVMLFAVLYIIRRKCGKHFNCCEIKKAKPPDNNILNADGTITLNSFPLRKITRPPALTPISASPSPPRDVTIKSDTPTPTPGVKNEVAAARFFASYKDAERSPIAAPLTTDFSRTTDTSLSQDCGDAAVGAMVAGRLQLDLHIRENKEEQDAMTRTHSLLAPGHKSREKIKRSHSTGPFPGHHEPKFDHNTDSLSRERRVTINDFEHIYPNVIVHAPGDAGPHSDEEYDVTQAQRTKGPQSFYVDSSGAHVIEVNVEGDSEGTEVAVPVEDHQKAKESWKRHSHSADSIYHLENEYQDDDLVEKEKLEIYAGVLREWKNRARQRYRIAKLAAQKEKNEYYSLRSLRSQDRGDRRSKSRSSPAIHHKASLSTFPIRRTHTVEEDPVYLSDVLRRREQFSCQPTRLYSSFDELEYQEQIGHNHHSSRRKRGSDRSSCDCPDCIFNRSESLGSDLSSVSRTIHSSRDKPERRGSYRERRRKEREKFRSASTTSDQSKYSKRQRHDSGSSYRHKHIRIRQNSSARSLPNLQMNPDSSTDSDFIKNASRSTEIQTKRATSRAEKKPLTTQPSQVQVHSSSPPPLPSIQITKSPSSDAGEKDLFRKVFSQEIELDDFSPAEEDDDPLILRSMSNSKENFLSSEHSFDYCIPDSNSTDNANPHLTLSVAYNDDGDNTGVSETSDPVSVPIETRRRNSVVTVKTGSFEATPISGKRSFDKQTLHDAAVSSDSPGTPTTCSVIMYDSNKSLDNHDTPPTIKSHSLLSRKHSSLDLTEPLRLLQTNNHVLRNASSMHELSNTWLQDEEEMEECVVSRTGNERNSVPYESKSSNSGRLGTDQTTSRRNGPSNKQPEPASIVSDSRVVKNRGDNSSKLRNQRPETASASSLSSSENVSPQQRRDSSISNPNNSDVMGSSHYLSVTDTDSAMSSAPSSQTTPNACKTVLSYDRINAEPKVKDSAYQTKQSSMETESNIDIRPRRPVPPIKEEDRKVTQRLHQAAVKLLVMQQRLRRSRQYMSKDSAVHTISEDDPTLDDIIVTSPKTRTFKPGVLYPAGHQEEEIIHEFPPLQCARIVEEQDVTTEYEV